MGTVADFIKRGMRTIGVIASGETPTSSELTDGLTVLNGLLGSLSKDGFVIYENKKETFSLVQSQAEYTFGVGGDFNSARPELINFVRLKNGVQEYPVNILTEREYADIGQKTMQSTFPDRVFSKGTFPLETLVFWPVPAEANSVVIYSKKPLTKFAATSDEIDWPEGYEDAVLYNFCVRYGLEFNKPLDPTIAVLANDLKANIKRSNMKTPLMKNDAYTSRHGYYDINKGPC